MSPIRSGFHFVCIIHSALWLWPPRQRRRLRLSEFTQLPIVSVIVNYCGIILSGGAGTRLRPATQAVSKQLMPVYDKPMVYYPLSTLMLAKIRDILVITTPRDQSAYRLLLGDGSQWGLSIRYAVQEEPSRIGQAFLIGKDFIANRPVCLVLGDNVFYGQGFTGTLERAASHSSGATVFGYWVRDPERYGVVTFDASGRVTKLEEKPARARSNYAVTGLYFYDNDVISVAESLRPSSRGELEITDINQAYLERGALRVELLGRGMAWLDTGTHESLLDAANFVRVIEERQGLKISCPEEIAYRQGFIGPDRVQETADSYGDASYSRYLRALLEEVPAPWIEPTGSPK